MNNNYSKEKSLELCKNDHSQWFNITKTDTFFHPIQLPYFYTPQAKMYMNYKAPNIKRRDSCVPSSTCDEGCMCRANNLICSKFSGQSCLCKCTIDKGKCGNHILKPVEFHIERAQNEREYKFILEEDVKEGQFIIEIVGIFKTIQEFQKEPGILRRHYFFGKEHPEIFCDAHFVGNSSRAIRNCCRSNSKIKEAWSEKYLKYMVVATKNIKKGEEVLLPWTMEDKGLKCLTFCPCESPWCKLVASKQEQIKLYPADHPPVINHTKKVVDAVKDFLNLIQNGESSMAQSKETFSFPEKALKQKLSVSLSEENSLKRKQPDSNRESSELKRVRSETFGPSIVQETPPPKPILTEEAVSKWSVEDVAKWLKDKNCDSEIIERLKKEKVDGEVFLCLDLSKLSIYKFQMGQSVKITRYVNTLKQELNNNNNDNLISNQSQPNFSSNYVYQSMPPITNNVPINPNSYILNNEQVQRMNTTSSNYTSITPLNPPTNILKPESMEQIYSPPSSSFSSNGELSEKIKKWNQLRDNLQVLEEITSLSLDKIAPDVKLIKLDLAYKVMSLRDYIPLLANVKYLQLKNSGNWCSLSELKLLSQLSNLEILQILHCSNQFSQEHANQLMTSVPNLKCLDLSGCSKLSRHALKLFENSELMYLGLSRVSLDHSILASFSNFKNLVAIDLSDQTHLQSILDLNKLPLLYLKLNNCPSLDDTNMGKALLGFPLLQTLHISGCFQLGQHTFSSIPKLVNLIDLDLSYISSLTDQTLDNCFQSLSKLQSLNISQCPFISDQQLLKLAQNPSYLPQLCNLNLDNCSLKNSETIDEIKEKRKKLEIKARIFF